ncbi:predicted protein [Naegleria gruberi]|uniref:Predicted protein n=1 Tax=Naegleria gruberi TaxID=5762 RepID=D2V0J4_NAEGR|nr:uncharacterized protein NAEGRDRAFT_62315 [Naegleria gruberi]EFC49733.1 predicted protein [Naegleria gruberi]|eukprot:XP_002682477.1 predicted protein [Naegleria gruberi strain NEG-M]
MSQSSVHGSQEEVEVAVFKKSKTKSKNGTKRILEVPPFNPSVPFSSNDIELIQHNNLEKLSKPQIAEIIIATNTNVSFLNSLNVSQLNGLKDIKHYMNKTITVPVLHKLNQEIVTHIVPILLKDDVSFSSKKRKSNPQPKEHKNEASSSKLSDTTPSQFQSKDLKKVDGNMLSITEDENVALFHKDDDGKLFYVGKAVCVKDLGESLVVEIIELEMNFTSKFQILTEYEWPKVKLCKFTYYSPSKLSVSEIKQKKNNFSMRELESNVSETVINEMEQLRVKLANAELELKKAKSELNEANRKIEQLENELNSNSGYDEDMQEVWRAMDELEKARKKVFKRSRKVTIYWGDNRDEGIVLEDTEVAELGLNQPTRAVVKLIMILAEKCSAFNLNTKYIMPGDNTKYPDARVKLDKETVDQLVTTIRKCIPCLSKKISVTEIKEHIASAFKQLRSKVDKMVDDDE